MEKRAFFFPWKETSISCRHWKECELVEDMTAVKETGSDRTRSELNFSTCHREKGLVQQLPTQTSGCSKTRKQINRDIYWMSCRQFAHSSSRAGPTAPRGHQKHKSRQPIKQEHAGEIFFGKKKKKKGKCFRKQLFQKPCRCYWDYWKQPQINKVIGLCEARTVPPSKWRHTRRGFRQQHK